MLWWAMLAVAAAVSLLVTVLLILAVRRRHRPGSSDNGTMPDGGDGDAAERKGVRWIMLGGVALPGAVVTVLFLVTALAMRSLTPPVDTPLEIEVTARQWWWDVRYRDARSGSSVRSANEIHIPVGQPVRIVLRSADVIHSFWVPQLAGKLDAVPGSENVFAIEADSAGVFRGQCAEFCGLQHSHMGFEVVAHDPADWVRWFVNERGPARAPADSLGEAGLRLFETRGCAMCHAVRGTAAAAEVGPDLTHFGIRRTLGAATRANIRGERAGWVADPHGIKPGVHMPSMNLPPDELLAIVHYLETLQ